MPREDEGDEGYEDEHEEEKSSDPLEDVGSFIMEGPDEPEESDDDD